MPGSVQAVRKMKRVVAMIERKRRRGNAGLICQVVGIIMMQKGMRMAKVQPYIQIIPMY